MNVTIQLKRKT